MEKKIADDDFARREIFDMCQNINAVLAQIDCSSEKHYSSCQKTVQGWRNLVFKNPTTLLRRTRLKSMNWWLRLVSFSVLTLFDSNTCESVAVFYI